MEIAIGLVKKIRNSSLKFWPDTIQKKKKEQMFQKSKLQRHVLLVML